METTTITLINGQEAIIDMADLERVSKYRWGAVKRPHTTYVQGTLRSNRMLLHRFIMDVTDPKILVDHKDHNGLNCSRSNLRIATPKQNAANKIGRGTSRFLGVRLANKQKKYWAAEIWIDSKSVHLGSFPFTPEGEKLAALAYNERAIKEHGEFANLNIVDFSPP